MPKFLNLIKFELECYLRFPILEIIIALALLLALYSPIIHYSFPMRIDNIMGTYIPFFFIFVAFIACINFSRSFAGSISRGESKLILSYPVKRYELFVSKLVGSLFPLFLVVGGAYSLNIPLLSLSPFDSIFYLALFAVFIQLTLACMIALGISLIVKNEITAILSSLLPLIVLESVGGNNWFVSGTGRFNLLLQFFDPAVFGGTQASAVEVAWSLSIPIIISIVLLFSSLIYFTKYLAID